MYRLVPIPELSKFDRKNNQKSSKINKLIICFLKIRNCGVTGPCRTVTYYR